MFYSFHTQEERQNSGGSSLVEMQFCEMPFSTKIHDLVSVNSIHRWKKDSLYIKVEKAFVEEYGNIFDCGIYNNLETGIVDIYGINYYAPKNVERIKKRIAEKKPKCYAMLLQWLEKSEKYNGVYVLGI